MGHCIIFSCDIQCISQENILKLSVLKRTGKRLFIHPWNHVISMYTSFKYLQKEGAVNLAHCIESRWRNTTWPPSPPSSDSALHPPVGPPPQRRSKAHTYIQDLFKCCQSLQIQFLAPLLGTTLRLKQIFFYTVCRGAFRGSSYHITSPTVPL